MSRWAYNTDAPPPQAFEAVEGAAQLIRDSNQLLDALYLGSNDQVYAHEEPVSKPANERWVVVSELQEVGGRIIDPSGLLKVKVHVKVVSPREMPNFARWHAAVHARIAKAIIGSVPAGLERSASVHGYRQTTEPSRPEFYADTDTRESFAIYAINLESVSAP